MKRFPLSPIAATALAVTAVAIGIAPSYGAPPAEDCAVPFPTSEITEGQAVTGLTVSKGTTPEPFTGEIIGVLDNGIAPGIDMIMARLTSPELERVGGIWAGMSGSPVYAEDGRLIGAVAYGLAGNTKVAGITPFEDMDEYLSSSASAARSSAATTRAGGYQPLPLVNTMAGVGQHRLDQADGARRWLRSGVRAASGAASSTSPGEESIVAGGNLAAAASWGDIVAGGVGTATSVCDSKVVGFGHPAFFNGPTTLALMPAKALYIQEDSSDVPFKVANLGAPVGTITDDRLTGITGRFGDVPEAMSITDTVTYGSRTRTGDSQVSRKELNAEVAFYQQLANHDVVLDGIIGGSELVTWTVVGRDAQGKEFTLSMRNRYVSDDDITYESPWEVADQLWVLSSLKGEDRVTIDRVEITSGVTDDTSKYSIVGVQQYRSRAWVTVSARNPIKSWPGHRLAVRTLLKSGTSTKRVLTAVRVPADAAGARGVYVVGDVDVEEEFEEEEEFPDEEYPTGSLASVLAYYRNLVSNDQVRGSLHLETEEGSLRPVSFRSSPVSRVVVGGRTIPVRIK